MKFIHLPERSANMFLRSSDIFLAAALLVLATGSWNCRGRGQHTDRDQENKTGIYESGTEKGKKVRLPDGTEVIMNAGTVIRLSPGFNKSDRNIELGGEALFTVEADAGKPFIVTTKNLRILVLGTQFRVDAFPGKAGEEVDLLSGRLKVMKTYHSDTDNEPEVLQAGEMVMINREIDLMEKERFDPSEEKSWGISPTANN